jgi:hypothetical protein
MMMTTTTTLRAERGVDARLDKTTLTSASIEEVCSKRRLSALGVFEIVMRGGNKAENSRRSDGGDLARIEEHDFDAGVLYALRRYPIFERIHLLLERALSCVKH